MGSKNDFSTWKNRKECYNQIIPQYLVEYKNDYANALSNKQIESLMKQVIRINDIAQEYPDTDFRGVAILFHEGEVMKNMSKIEMKMKNIEWALNLDFVFYYFNKKEQKTWMVTDTEVSILNVSNE